jgi:hypothetical protein
MSYTGECATMDNLTTPLRRCNTCSVEYPETLEYFHKGKGNRGGLKLTCKKCRSAEYYANPEPTKARSSESYYANPEYHYQQCRERRKKNPEAWKGYQQKYADTHKEQLQAKGRCYYAENKTEISLRGAKRRRQNPHKYTKRPINPDERRVSKNRRRARKRSLPDTFTVQDWKRAVEYFHGRCAVCGRQCKNLFGTRTIAADHWIPLDSPNCPGTTPENMIPLCHGEDDCNCSKGSKDPIEWLNWKFGKRKASEILQRITTYFEWLKEQQ